MGKVYTEDYIKCQIDGAKADMPHFYRKEFINYRGKTLDTNRYYTEIIAEWCCNNLALLESIDGITREGSYKIAMHDGIPPKANSNRTEELIAMAMFRQKKLPEVGEVIDYQTPLKNEKDDKAGKIDLLAYDGKTLRILELKKPDSKETMLRCVLEGYTYLRTVNTEKLIKDFSKDRAVPIPKDTKVETCPFVFENGVQHNEVKDDRPWLKKLMALLNITPYYIRNDAEPYDVIKG